MTQQTLREKFKEKYGVFGVIDLKAIGEDEIFNFFTSEFSKILEEVEQNYKTAIAYNCEPEEIERIFEAYKALASKHILEIKEKIK